MVLVVQDVLEEAGLRGELENWFLVETTGLSNNGRVLWRTGINPDGIVEAWVATVPEPKIHGAIFVLLLVLRRRWRTV